MFKSELNLTNKECLVKKSYETMKEENFLLAQVRISTLASHPHVRWWGSVQKPKPHEITKRVERRVKRKGWNLS